MLSSLLASGLDLGKHERDHQEPVHPHRTGIRMAARREAFIRRRKAVGFTQETLAADLCLDAKTIARWERGETTPKPDHRPDVARSLDVSLDALADLLDSDPVTPRDPAVDADRLRVGPKADTGLGAPGGVSLDSVDRKTFLKATLGVGAGVAVAHCLPGPNVDPDELLTAVAGPTTSPDRSDNLTVGHGGMDWAAAIHSAVMDPGAAMRAALAAGGARKPMPLKELRRSVDRVTRHSLLSDYHALGRTLPTLLGHGEALAAGDVARRVDARQSLAMLSDSYALAAWTLIKAGAAPSAWVAAERALTAAEHADDRVRMAAAVRCKAEVAMCNGDLDLAMHTALMATVHLTSPRPDQARLATSLRGAALLSAAAAAARGGNARDAYTSLQAAADCALSLQEDSYDLATVFGPTNVAIHRVVIPLELGDPRTAARHVPHMSLDALPRALGERHSRALIDVARVKTLLNDNTAAIGALHEAEAVAPSELRNHRHTQALVPELGRRERAGSGLRELAGRCNIPL